MVEHVYLISFCMTNQQSPLSGVKCQRGILSRKAHIYTWHNCILINNPVCLETCNTTLALIRARKATYTENAQFWKITGG